MIFDVYLKDLIGQKSSIRIDDSVISLKQEKF